MANFDEILQELKNNALTIIKETLFQYKDQAQKDANAFLDSSKNKLEKWTNALINEDLSVEDFKWLLESQKDLMLMNGLKQAGLGKIQIDKLKNAMVNMIVDTVVDFVL